jgi:hypothetical protein
MRWIQVDVVRFADCPMLAEICGRFFLEQETLHMRARFTTDICLSNSAEEASGISFSKHSPLKLNVSFANHFCGNRYNCTLGSH